MPTSITMASILQQGVSPKNSELILQSDFLVCLDNFNPNSGHHIASLRKMISLGRRFRYVLFCDDVAGILSHVSKLKHILSGAKFVDIGQLSRRLIRELSTKKLLNRGAFDQDVVDYIIKQFQNNDLPRNGYIVTLLLWAWERRVRSEKLNEAVLLQAFTDHMLEATDFTKAIRGAFDTKLKALLLQELAHRMTKLGDHEDALSLQSYLRLFLRQKGLEFDATEVLLTLCASGILMKSHDMVSFRYRCFQEYFNALYIASNPESALEACASENILSLAREIDLITSLERTTRNFDTALLNAIGQAFNVPSDKLPINVSLLRLNFDKSMLRLEGSRSKLLESVNITQEAVDDLNDLAESNKANGKRAPNRLGANLREGEAKSGSGIVNDDAHVGKASLGTTQPTKFTILEINALIHLLARVVRNAEFNDLAKKASLTRAVFGSLIRFLLLFFETVEKSRDKLKEVIQRKRPDEDVEQQVQTILNFGKIILPGFASSALSDDISSPSMSKVFEEVADDVDTAFDIRLFACFSLIDIGRQTGFSKLLQLLASEKSDLHSFVALERLTITYLTNSLPLRIKGFYINAIAEVESGLAKRGQKGVLAKGFRINQLKNQGIEEEA